MKFFRTKHGNIVSSTEIITHCHLELGVNISEDNPFFKIYCEKYLSDIILEEITPSYVELIENGKTAHAILSYSKNTGKSISESRIEMNNLKDLLSKDIQYQNKMRIEIPRSFKKKGYNIMSSMTTTINKETIKDSTNEIVVIIVYVDEQFTTSKHGIGVSLFKAVCLNYFIGKGDILFVPYLDSIITVSLDDNVIEENGIIYCMVSLDDLNKNDGYVAALKLF